MLERAWYIHLHQWLAILLLQHCSCCSRRNLITFRNEPHNSTPTARWAAYGSLLRFRAHIIQPAFPLQFLCVLRLFRSHKYRFGCHYAAQIIYGAPPLPISLHSPHQCPTIRLNIALESQRRHWKVLFIAQDVSHDSPTSLVTKYNSSLTHYHWK